jgi:drug/metabolite transporter (DMT)-like permease
MSEAPFPVEPAHVRRPRLGYAMAAAAALLWGVNGAVSKTILSTGLSSERLAQVRSLGAALGLFAIVAVLAPRRLRLTRRELPYIVVFGVVGLAFVQWFYFLAIHRLAIGVALLIEYLAPLLVALWARFAYALYVLLAEHVVGGRDPVSLLAWGFFFTSVFWAVLVPWWTFPPHALTNSTSLHGHLDAVSLPVWVLALWMIVLGTIVPFFLLVSALRHLSATRVGIVAMLEPVAGALIAWIWLAEGLGGVQLVGAGVVLAAIVLAQTAR